MLEHYLSIAVRAAFTDNMVLALFLGLCPFMACSRRLETAVGLGFAVIFVLSVTVPINQLIFEGLLQKGALRWLNPALSEVDLSFLKYLVFIGTIAATVQIVEMSVDRYAPRLFQALGVFLPLIAVNCAILGGSLFMAERKYTLAESAVFGFGAGFGWALAIVALAAIRERLRYSNVPEALRGVGVTFMIAGLMAMGFMMFGGIRL